MRAHAAVFEPRDCCLVRKLGPRISFKIDDRWEDIYVMDSRAEDLPVYMVVRKMGWVQDRLHRNFLLPVGFLGIAPTVPQRPQKPHDHKSIKIN